jgi:hypothetical protein
LSAFLGRIFKNTQITNIMKIRTVGRTD